MDHVVVGREERPDIVAQDEDHGADHHGQHHDDLEGGVGVAPGGTVVALLVAAFLARKLIHKRKARKAKKNAAPVEELDTPIESDDQSTEQHTK